MIQEIVNNFDSVSKSIEPNRRTKKTEIFVVFEKKYDDGTVKLVKLRNLVEKSLSLKTLFRKDWLPSRPKTTGEDDSCGLMPKPQTYVW